MMIELASSHVSQNPLTQTRTHGPSFWKMADRLGQMSESDRIQSIKSGLDVEMADAVRQTFGLTAQRLSRLLNLSVATFERRRKSAKPLNMAASERLDRIASVALLAKQVFENENAASTWLSTPNPALDGNVPIMHCETAIGARQVRRILNALEWGGVV